MPLIFDGVQIERVIYNGVEIEKLYHGDVLVFERAFNVNITLSGSYQNLNLRQHFINMGWDGVRPVKGTVTLSGYCYASSPTAHPLTITGLTAGSDITLHITSTGSIRGAGGAGGSTTGTKSSRRPTIGGVGGDGLYVYNDNGSIIRVRNDGYIAGGGGGGGAAAYYIPPGQYSQEVDAYGFGGGGAGTTGGAAGGTGAAAGTATAGGAGSNFGDMARGGAGGGPGQPGSPGAGLGYTSAGGDAGWAVVGNNRITWIKVGTIYGARVNN